MLMPEYTTVASEKLKFAILIGLTVITASPDVVLVIIYLILQTMKWLILQHDILSEHIIYLGVDISFITHWECSKVA